MTRELARVDDSMSSLNDGVFKQTLPKLGKYKRNSVHRTESKDTLHSRKASQIDYTNSKRGSIGFHEVQTQETTRSTAQRLPLVNLQHNELPEDQDSFFSPRTVPKAS